MNKSQMKQYARKCLTNGTGGRALDNCFENGEELANDIVRYLMNYASERNIMLLKYTADKLDIPVGTSAPYEVFKKHTRARDAYLNAVKLRENLIRTGTYEYWEYFINNGTFVGFKRKVAL